jgi:hypothetical protein
VLFLKLTTVTCPISPDRSWPGAGGIEGLLGYAGGCEPICAGVDLLASLAVADGGSIFGSPDRAELVDVRNGLACGLRPCRGAFGLVEHPAACKRISSKRVFRLLKGEMAMTVSWFERGGSPTARDLRWACCAWRAAA